MLRPASQKPLLYGPDGLPLAPSVVGLSKKSADPRAEDRFIKYCVSGAAGVSATIPVVWGRDLIGWTVGRQGSRRAVFYRRPPGLRLTGITTYDDLINAMGAGRRYTGIFSKAHTSAPVANNWYDLWPVGGNPAAGAYGGSALTAKQLSDATAGSLFTFGNVESTYNKFLSYVTGQSSAGTPGLLLYDRVLTYEACGFSTGSQSFTNTLPALRYIAAGQSGLKVVVTGQTVLGATASNITTLTYVNQAGTGSQTMPTGRTVAVIVSAAAPTGTLGSRVVSPADTGVATTWGWALPLATGDSGVRSLTNFTCSGANTGTLCFILMNNFVWWGLGTAGLPTQIDQVVQLANLPRIYDGACVSLMAYFPAATATTLVGDVNVAWN